jgi:hypothetical protein
LRYFDLNIYRVNQWIISWHCCRLVWHFNIFDLGCYFPSIVTTRFTESSEWSTCWVVRFHSTRLSIDGRFGSQWNHCISYTQMWRSRRRPRDYLNHCERSKQCTVLSAEEYRRSCKSNLFFLGEPAKFMDMLWFQDYAHQIVSLFPPFSEKGQ